MKRTIRLIRIWYYGRLKLAKSIKKRTLLNVKINVGWPRHKLPRRPVYRPNPEIQKLLNSNNNG